MHSLEAGGSLNCFPVVYGALNGNVLIFAASVSVVQCSETWSLHRSVGIFNEYA
jgi:hypothetical protein